MTNLDHALEYLRQGWSVFPVVPGEKRPLLRTWEHLQQRLPTAEQVTAWWTQHPDANIAIVTGAVSGIVVVDVDPIHGGTADGLPPTGCVQRTRNGGTQHVYAYPTGVTRVPNQVDVGGTGRDVRGDGGYIVAPPSAVPADPETDGPGFYAWEAWNPTDLGQAPDWAIAPPLTDDGEPVKDRWLDDLFRNGAKPGERNNSLIKMAGYLAKLAMPMDAALTLAHQWSERLDIPLPRDEVDVTVKSAYKMERRRAREREPKIVNDDLLPMHPLPDYMARHGDSEVKWTIRDWLPQGTICFLVSPPQSYKTFVTFDLACSVASGAPFLGQYPVNNPGPVAIFQQEDPHSNIAERTSIIAHARLGLQPTRWDDGDDTMTVPTIDMSNLPIYYHEDRKLRFDDPEVMDALEAWIAAIRPRLVIIDPLYMAVDTVNDEYMAKAARKMARIKDMRDRYGTSFVIVHHSKKSVETWDREKVWGSQFINAFIETSWLMRKPVNEDATVIQRHFKVAGRQPFVKIVFEMQTDEAPYFYRATPHVISSDEADLVVKGKPSKPGDEQPNAEEPRVMKFLKDGPATMETICAALELDPVTANKTLRGLLGKHRIRVDAIGKWETLDVDMP